MSSPITLSVSSKFSSQIYQLLNETATGYSEGMLTSDDQQTIKVQIISRWGTMPDFLSGKAIASE
jgi:hypothetical protein